MFLQGVRCGRGARSGRWSPFCFLSYGLGGLGAFRLWRRAFDWYDALRDKGRERKRTLIVGGAATRAG